MEIVSFVVGVLVIALGIAVSIALHEIGHLVPAKTFNVLTSKYMIGFGPTLFSWKRGETEYGIKAFPLGGYVAMAGMYPPTGKPVRGPKFIRDLVEEARSQSMADIPPGSEGRLFYQLPVWKRLIIMLGGPLMNLVVALVLFAVLISGFGISQSTTTVSYVAECVIPATEKNQQECAPGDPASPAAAAGLIPGDTIVALDGHEVTAWNQLTDTIQQSPGKELQLTVERDGETRQLSLVPLQTERPISNSRGVPELGADGKQVVEKVGFAGVSPTTQIVQQPITEVFPMVGDYLTQTANVILHLPQRLYEVGLAAFGPEERDPNGPLSVVGVGRVAGEIASIEDASVATRFAGLLSLVASMNLALFAFNLIPLLPLDGGHILGALWEAVRRFFAKLFGKADPGPVDMAKALPLTYAVTFLLMGMGALLIYADIVKPISLSG